MKLRVWNTMNYIDVVTKDMIDKKILIQAIDNQDTIMLDTIDGTTIFINCINVIAIEILDMPPSQNE